MKSCCDIFCSATERQFDERAAARDLRRYRRSGPDATTRLLRDGVRAQAPEASTLLDIGAGIGALTFELLDAGIQRAVAIDASTAYVAIGREEAARRGLATRVEWTQGDFVSVVDTLYPADVVTLDRVVCCYPFFRGLLAHASRLARRCLALTYPRGRLSVRLGMAAQNAVRALRGNAFRTFVHPPRAMEELVRAAGFRLVSRQKSFVWCADIYVRAGRRLASACSWPALQV
jgi:SAM-dependent methyltransferase